MQAWRRRLNPEEATVDLGVIQLDPTEVPPGVTGQAWDTVRDTPIPQGRAELRSGARLVASDTIDGDGTFAVELSPSCLLLPGLYTLTVTAPGYRAGRRMFEVTVDVTSYLLGRVELGPTTPG